MYVSIYLKKKKIYIYIYKKKKKKKGDYVYPTDMLILRFIIAP